MSTSSCNWRYFELYNPLKLICWFILFIYTDPITEYNETHWASGTCSFLFEQNAHGTVCGSALEAVSTNAVKPVSRFSIQFTKVWKSVTRLNIANWLINSVSVTPWIYEWLLSCTGWAICRNYCVFLVSHVQLFLHSRLEKYCYLNFSRHCSATAFLFFQPSRCVCDSGSTYWFFHKMAWASINRLCNRVLRQKRTTSIQSQW